MSRLKQTADALPQRTADTTPRPDGPATKQTNEEEEEDLPTPPFSPVRTRQRANSSVDMIPSPKRQASNSQHILDVFAVAQQVGSKAIAGTLA
jgi:hypothetical protein